MFFNRSVLAMFCSLFGSLLRCVSGAGQWGARGAGAPTGGRVESIIFWAAAIRFSLKYLFNRSVFRRFFAKNNGIPIRLCPK
jgi:hypothetical protein